MKNRKGKKGNTTNYFYAFLFTISAIILITYQISLIEILRKVFSIQALFQTILIIPCVLIFANTIMQSNLLKKFIHHLSLSSNSPRILLFFSSLGLGVLPIQGRTLFSAPVIKGFADYFKIDNKRAALLNYIVNHYYYLFSPLSTSLILFLSISGLMYKEVVFYMFPVLFIMMLFTWYYMIDIPKNKLTNDFKIKELVKSSYYLLPVIVTIVIALITKQLIIGVIIGIFTSLIMIQFNISIRKMLNNDYKLLYILIIILFFKETITKSGIGTQVANYILVTGLHPALFIILIGLSTGLLLGSSRNMVLFSFPIAIPFIPEGQILSYSVLLYISNFAGYMTSPAHLCPTIAREYFNVKLSYFYKHSAILSLCILVAGIITFSAQQLLR